VDRLDAMQAFVTAVDSGSLAAAARRLGRSPASITRAVALVEQRTRAQLLRRTTRSLKLTPAGERFLAACRTILATLAEAEQQLGTAEDAPHGTLVVTAPALFGRRYVLPVIEGLHAAHRELAIELLLLDRVVNLVDEGVDAAVRIGHLPDSALVAVRVGEIHRVVCASPGYLARAKRSPRAPADLRDHDCIAVTPLVPTAQWSFAGRQAVRVQPRLRVNTADAALALAAADRGVTCVLSYQADEYLADGRLRRLLAAFEPPPLPVHVLHPAGHAAKLRAFVAAAVPHLRCVLATARRR
jgi:DNA-binding transcriptional LysR family regulator